MHTVFGTDKKTITEFRLETWIQDSQTSTYDLELFCRPTGFTGRTPARRLEFVLVIRLAR